VTHPDPVHVIDFRDEWNCAHIESAKPGESLEIKVRLERPLDSQSLTAKGVRSADGKSFEVTVSSPNGSETHSWSWEFLVDALRVHRGTPG